MDAFPTKDSQFESLQRLVAELQEENARLQAFIKELDEEDSQELVVLPAQQ